MDEALQMTLDRLLQNAVDAAEEQTGPSISNKLREALNGLAASSDPDAVRKGLALRLVDVNSPAGVGWLALWLGGGTEGGRDPDPVIPFLMDALLRWSKTIQLTDDGEVDGEFREDVKSGLQSLGQGLVAHLARSPVQWEHFSKQPNVIAELDRTLHVSLGVYWVAELLRKRSGTLLVLHVEGQKGCMVNYQNLSNCFHLFTLLQNALTGIVPGARSAPRNVMAAALGEATEDVSDTACWHYGRGDVPESNIAASVWGEGSPVDIPSLDQCQVLLLWPPILSGRSWDGGFFTPFHAAAPPRLTVLNELTRPQIDDWWKKLGLPSRPEKPWWILW